MEQRELVCVSDCGHFGSALGFLSLRCLLSSCWIGGGVLRLFTFLSNLQTYAYLFSCFFPSLCAVKSEAILRLSLSSSLSPSLSHSLFFSSSCSPFSLQNGPQLALSCHSRLLPHESALAITSQQPLIVLTFPGRRADA